MTDLSVTVTERVYPSGEKVYMARFRDPDGRLVRSKVIKDVRTRDQANRKAAQLANSGKIVSKKNNPLVLEYLADFWNENGAYVSSKARQNKPMSPRYVEQSARLVQRHFSQVLKNKRMSQLTPGLIEDAITIMSKSGLSNRSINIAVQTVRVPVAYYARMQNIIDPLRNASKQDETSTPRGVLTLAEVGAIVNLEGEAPRIKAAVLLGALCGLRLGEVRGLQWEDVDFEKRLINVIHNNPSGEDDIRKPKKGSERVIPLPSVVADELKLVLSMPRPKDSPFVIYNEKRNDRPATTAAIRAGFRRMLQGINISNEDIRNRNLVFHGLRHSFVSLSRAAGIPDYIVQKLAGHKTAAMMEHYSDHAENVVPFLPQAAEGMARILANATEEAKKASESGA